MKNRGRLLRQPGQRRGSLRTFLIPFLFLLSMGGVAQKTPADSSIVATVNGEPVTCSEFILFARKERGRIIRGNPAGDPDDLSGKIGGQAGGKEQPEDILKKRTLDTLSFIKVEQILARSMGIVTDISYKGFLGRLAKENRRREEALKRNEVIYGPVQYSEEVYYDYLHSNMILILKKSLDGTKLKVTNEEIGVFYENEKQHLGDRSLDQCQGVIRRMLLDRKFDAFMLDMKRSARVDLDSTVYNRIRFPFSLSQ